VNADELPEGLPKKLVEKLIGVSTNVTEMMDTMQAVHGKPYARLVAMMANCEQVTHLFGNTISHAISHLDTPGKPPMCLAADIALYSSSLHDVLGMCIVGYADAIGIADGSDMWKSALKDAENIVKRSQVK